MELDENALWYTQEFVDYVSERADATPDTWTEGMLRGTLQHLDSSDVGNQDRVGSAAAIEQKQP